MAKPETAASQESFFAEVLQLKRLWCSFERSVDIVGRIGVNTCDFSLCFGSALFD